MLYLNRKFKESCDSLEMLNNRERKYLDTITELKSRLIASDKLIRNQDIIITDLNKRLNNLPIKNKVCVLNYFFYNYFFIPYNLYYNAGKRECEWKYSN